MGTLLNTTKYYCTLLNTIGYYGHTTKYYRYTTKYYIWLSCRYNILPESHRRSFGAEEDHLLSIIAHNLLIYMLMVGMGSKVTMDLVQGFTARTRLATVEEKLLQRTMQHVEQNVCTLYIDIGGHLLATPILALVLIQ